MNTQRKSGARRLPARLETKSGYDFYEIASLLQKSLRRGDLVYAARAANELLPKYANYVWNRLMTVSAEDCAEMVTGEIVALYEAWHKVNQGQKGSPRGRVFVAKAIVLLSKSRHSRDSDELNILVSDRLPDDEFDQAVDSVESVLDVPPEHFEIPRYVFDVHTRRGKRMGKTRRDFLVEEHEALTDQSTLFDNFDEMVGSDDYVPPAVSWDESEGQR